MKATRIALYPFTQFYPKYRHRLFSQAFNLLQLYSVFCKVVSFQSSVFFGIDSASSLLCTFKEIKVSSLHQFFDTVVMNELVGEELIGSCRDVVVVMVEWRDEGMTIGGMAEIEGAKSLQRELNLPHISLNVWKCFHGSRGIFLFNNSVETIDTSSISHLMNSLVSSIHSFFSSIL